MGAQGSVAECPIFVSFEGTITAARVEDFCALFNSCLTAADVLKQKECRCQ